MTAKLHRRSSPIVTKPMATDTTVCDGDCGCCFFSSRRRHTRFDCDWSSDVCSSDLLLFVDTTFLPLLERLAPSLPADSRIILMTDEGNQPQTNLPVLACYERLLADRKSVV